MCSRIARRTASIVGLCLVVGMPVGMFGCSYFQVKEVPQADGTIKITTAASEILENSAELVKEGSGILGYRLAGEAVGGILTLIAGGVAVVARSRNKKTDSMLGTVITGVEYGAENVVTAKNDIIKFIQSGVVKDKETEARLVAEVKDAFGKGNSVKRVIEDLSIKSNTWNVLDERIQNIVRLLKHKNA